MSYRFPLLLPLLLISFFQSNLYSQCDCAPVSMETAGSGPEATPYTASRHDANYAEMQRSLNCMINCMRSQRARVFVLEDSVRRLRQERALMQSSLAQMASLVDSLDRSVSSKIDSLNFATQGGSVAQELYTDNKPCTACNMSGVAETDGFLLGSLELEDPTLDAIGALVATVGTQRISAHVYCVETTCISSDFFLIPVQKGTAWSVILQPELTRNHAGNLKSNVIWMPVLQY